MKDQFQIPAKNKNLFYSISQFEIQHKIGRGAFSEVFLSVAKNTQNLYAIKIIDLEKISKNDYPNLSREILIHRSTNHQNITTLYDYFKEENKVYLVLEYCANGNLFQKIYQQEKIQLSLIQSYIKQLINALLYLHSMNLIHRDLKPENLLLDQNCQRLTICDFGWACHIYDYSWMKIRAGTKQYMAPEVLSNQNQSQKTDVWAVGILLYELLYKKEPFDGDSWQNMYNSIQQGLKFQENQDVPETAINLIKLILKFNQNERPSLQEILQHQFFYQDFNQQQNNNLQKQNIDYRQHQSQQQNQIKEYSQLQNNTLKRNYSKSYSKSNIWVDSKFQQNQNSYKKSIKDLNSLSTNINVNLNTSKTSINHSLNYSSPKKIPAQDYYINHYRKNFPKTSIQKNMKLPEIQNGNFKNIYSKFNIRKQQNFNLNSYNRDLNQTQYIANLGLQNFPLKNNTEKDRSEIQQKLQKNKPIYKSSSLISQTPQFQNNKLQKLFNVHVQPHDVQQKYSIYDKKTQNSYYQITPLKSEIHNTIQTQKTPNRYISKSFQRGVKVSLHQMSMQNNIDRLQKSNQIQRQNSRDFYIKRSLKVFSKSPSKLVRVNTSIINSTKKI